MSGVRVGVDVGGTKIAVARVDGAAVVGDIMRAPTPSGGAAVLDTISALVGAVCDGVPDAVGVASAGVIDEAGRVDGSAATMTGWAGTDVKGGLESRLGCRVGVLNDVHAIALAEARYGAGSGAGRVLAIALGTGIGGGLVVDGALVRGAHSVAASVGHVGVRQAGSVRCTCGGRGHVEMCASGPAFEARYSVRAGERLSLREIVARADAGEGAATDTLREGAEALGEAIASVAAVVDPDIIVIGGGVATLGERILHPARAVFRDVGMPALSEVPIVLAGLGLTAPLVGAVLASVGLH